MDLLLPFLAMLMVASAQLPSVSAPGPRVTDDDVAIMVAVLEGPLADRACAGATRTASPHFIVLDQTVRVCQPRFETQPLECFELAPHHALKARNAAAAKIPNLPTRAAEIKPFSTAAPTITAQCSSFRERFPGATTFVQFGLPVSTGRGLAEIYVALRCGELGDFGALVRLSRRGGAWNAGPLEVGLDALTLTCRVPIGN